jgi:hypothetical protein
MEDEYGKATTPIRAGFMPWIDYTMHTGINVRDKREESESMADRRK